MKILLHSHTFWPNVGGIETASHLLATGFLAAGHQVSVVTETECGRKSDFAYPVFANLEAKKLSQLLAGHDLVHANGASMRLFAESRRLGRPFVWTHQGYQLLCIDGLGWEQGSPAPLTPWKSIAHHCRLHGFRRAALGAAKLWLRRSIACHVAANVAVSQHVAKRQPLPRQCVIYNPVDTGRFSCGTLERALENLHLAQDTFTFVGRLVSEKGVDDLIHAFASLVRTEKLAKPPTLKIIGDGPERPRLEELAAGLGLSDYVRFAGQKTDGALTDEIKKAGICVLPSAFEEPMGIVAVELMAAGKPLIVSATGALSEISGKASLTYANSNRQELAAAMLRLWLDEQLKRELVSGALSRCSDFEASRQASAYLDLFLQIMAEKKRL